MIDPEDANYKCTLTPESLEKAIRELHEDPEKRLEAVHTLREWIREQPHLTCPTDTDFLLQILRTAKFSQQRARELVETYLTMKTKLTKLMSNLDSTDSGILAFVEKGASISLPKLDAEGRHISIMRPGAIDFNDPVMTDENEFRNGMALNFLTKENNENVVVNGELLVLDMTGFSAKHVARMSSQEHQADFNKVYQECTFGRMKGFHIYNGGPFVEIVMAIVRPFLSKKNLDRIHIHDTMESLFQVIPMELWPDEYLPDDYTGPSAGSIKSIADDMKRQLSDPAFRERLLEFSSDKYKIDVKEKPVDIPQDSFTKLAID